MDMCVFVCFDVLKFQWLTPHAADPRLDVDLMGGWLCRNIHPGSRQGSGGGNEKDIVAAQD